ncbi:MAG: intersectin-EH binding protein Ibp1 [Actinobacteria bacterium]|nr:intersectin-EH binding protein Ibp1 [Actinomycetota bacterium]
MATYRFSVRRLILAGGFAVAVTAAPVIAAFATPIGDTQVPLASCTNGEEEDVYTTTCTPFMVPNSPFSTPLGNPDVPEVDGVPCMGNNAGQCIGLAESAEADGPEAVPRTSISASP